MGCWNVITLTVITLSGFYCISERILRTSCSGCLFIGNLYFIRVRPLSRDIPQISVHSIAYKPIVWELPWIKKSGLLKSEFTSLNWICFKYLERGEETEVRCRDTKICENGWIFWPPEQDCFQLYTQGPCHKVKAVVDVVVAVVVVTQGPCHT